LVNPRDSAIEYGRNSGRIVEKQGTDAATIRAGINQLLDEAPI
jgi:hypothetical protein